MFFRLVFIENGNKVTNNHSLPPDMASGWYSMKDKTKEDILNEFSENHIVKCFQFTEGYGKEIETIYFKIKQLKDKF